MGSNVSVRDINPKSQDTNALYGSWDSKTRDWKDGIFSKVVRDFSKAEDRNPKWIVLDGDLDANWIESMNFAMDSNRVLTLASNERIPIGKHMRLLFEISELEHATPASVSRASILYIGTEDGSQWRALIASWVLRKMCPDFVKEAMQMIFEKYVERIFIKLRLEFKSLVPIAETSMVSNMLSMLDATLTDEQLGATSMNSATKKMEPVFVFAAIWAFGSCLSEKQGKDYRKAFSEWWKGEFKTVKFPSRDTIFDYYLNSESGKLDMWKNSSFYYHVDFDSAEMSLASITIPTPDTASISFWTNHLLHMSHPTLSCRTSWLWKDNNYSRSP